MVVCVSCALVPPSAAAAVENDEGGLAFRSQPRVKRNWQWSKGAGPGEYGGPPPIHTIDKPLKMWGKPIEHPLDNKNDYIWNMNWKPFFDEESSEPIKTISTKDTSSGYLSFSRVMEIDRVDVDLTEELLKPDVRKPESSDRTRPTRRWNYAPTRRERQYWDRSRKASDSVRSSAQQGASVSNGSATERRKYTELASRLQQFTVAIGGAGTASTFFLYSSEVSLSYVFGLLGSFAYIRMLGSSVDALGRGDAKGAVKGALGQPRLLVPLILAMTLNRWNELAVPQFGVAELQLIPMLAGFFTYKLATIVQVVQDVLPVPVHGNDP